MCGYFLGKINQVGVIGIYFKIIFALIGLNLPKLLSL